MNKIQGSSRGGAVGGVYDKLSQQITTHSLSCIFEHIGGHVDLAGASKADQAITQLIAFDQHENDEYHHDGRGYDDV